MPEMDFNILAGLDSTLFMIHGFSEQGVWRFDHQAERSGSLADLLWFSGICAAKGMV